MADKITIPYEHDSQDLSQIYMAFSLGTPREGDWKPALRDTVDGRKVIWVKFPSPVPQGNLWVRDRLGSRRVDGRPVAGPSSDVPHRARRRR